MSPAGVVRKRRLPHWDMPGAVYFVTSCLVGSVSDEEERSIRRARKGREGGGDGREQPSSERLRKRYVDAFRAADQRWDTAPRVRWLERPELAAEVRQSVYHFAEDRYRVWAYVVMPSHLHWVFHPTPQYEAQFPDESRTPREAIMQSLKSYTARVCNGFLGRSGQFWQHESYDHWVRDDRELYWIIQYVRNNPVTAGLASTPEEFRFSSAHDRKLWGIEEGLPLCPPT